MNADDSLDIPSCALDPTGLDSQRARYRRLAQDVTDIERTDATVIVTFAPSVDRELLAETLGVERACCPFFAFDVDDVTRRLTIGVSRPDQVPALDALSSALSPRH